MLQSLLGSWIVSDALRRKAWVWALCLSCFYDTLFSPSVNVTDFTYSCPFSCQMINLIEILTCLVVKCLYKGNQSLHDLFPCFFLFIFSIHIFSLSLSTIKPLHSLLNLLLKCLYFALYVDVDVLAFNFFEHYPFFLCLRKPDFSFFYTKSTEINT